MKPGDGTARLSTGFGSPGPQVLKLLYRFGLGWLVGRRWLLMVTNDAAGAGTRTSVHRYRLEDGAVVVPSRPAPWLEDLAAKPVATIHAHPGPLAVAAELGTDEVVFSPTGRPAPPPIVPDLNWVIPVVVVAFLALRALVPLPRSGRGGPVRGRGGQPVVR
jgi:hypothetical protein